MKKWILACCALVLFQGHTWADADAALALAKAKQSARERERMAAPVQGVQAQRLSAGAAGVPTTYAERRQTALAEGKPLITWVGGNICPDCVAGTEGEFVHFFVFAHSSAPTPSIVVELPEGGTLRRLPPVTKWANPGSGDHIRSVRRAIADDRARRIPPASGLSATGRWMPSQTRGVPAPAFAPMRTRGRVSGC